MFFHLKFLYLITGRPNVFLGLKQNLNRGLLIAFR